MQIDRLQYCHWKQLIIGWHKQHIRHIVNIIHITSRDNAWKLYVCRWILHNLLQLLIAVCNFSKRKASAPDKAHIRQLFRNIDKIQHALSCLYLSDTDDDKFIRFDSILLTNGIALLYRLHIKLLLGYIIRNIDHLLPGNSVFLQLLHKNRIYNNQIIRCFIEADHIFFKHRKQCLRKLYTSIERVR